MTNVYTLTNMYKHFFHWSFDIIDSSSKPFNKLFLLVSISFQLNWWVFQLNTSGITSIFSLEFQMCTVTHGLRTCYSFPMPTSSCTMPINRWKDAVSMFILYPFSFCKKFLLPISKRKLKNISLQLIHIYNLKNLLHLHLCPLSKERKKEKGKLD